jgi:hypothetical protein
VFEAIEWPNNYASGCGISVSFDINDTELIEMMAAHLFMVSCTSHYVQTYLLDSHLLGTCLGMTVVYMDAS